MTTTSYNLKDSLSLNHNNEYCVRCGFNQEQSQDYAVASWLLEHSQLPAHGIELPRAIAKNSIHY